MRPHASFEWDRVDPETRRTVKDERIVLYVDRGLRSRRIDEHRLTPEEARALAIDLLLAVEAAGGIRRP